MPRSPRLAATLAAVALLATSLQAIPATAATAVPPADLTALVNPFVGTKNFGNTFPGASAPFGMAQVSPDTGGQGGYDYSRNTLYGFSQTHLSGVGCEVMGELPVMPTSGAIGSVRHDQYGSVFSHARVISTVKIDVVCSSIRTVLGCLVRGRMLVKDDVTGWCSVGRVVWPSAVGDG